MATKKAAAGVSAATPKSKPKAAKATPAPPRTAGGAVSLKVEATQTGFYSMKRRRAGELESPKHYSTRWMRWVDPETPERISSSADALAQRRKEIKEEKHAERTGAKIDRPALVDDGTEGAEDDVV
jgi:hypothetical protein